MIIMDGADLHLAVVRSLHFVLIHFKTARMNIMRSMSSKAEKFLFYFVRGGK